MQNELITLVDEEGNEHQFMLLDIINVRESDYAIMVATDELADDEADEQETVIFRIEENENGQQTLIVVEEDDEWEAVAAWEEHRIGRRVGVENGGLGHEEGEKAAGSIGIVIITGCCRCRSYSYTGS